MISLKNKLALVTGGSRGIGRATVLLLSQAGAKVIFTYHHHTQAAKTVLRQAQKYQPSCLALKVDLNQLEEIKQLFALVKSQYHRLDILVNNAGIIRRRPLLITPVSELDEHISINFTGVFLCMQHGLKIMLPQKSGRIINLASSVGISGDAGLAAYAATKGAVIALTKSAAKEVGRAGITVNGVAPGLIDTDMNRDLSAHTKQKLIEKISLRRFGTPEEVAKVILFLCSDLSAYLNGAIISVDGGQII